MRSPSILAAAPLVALFALLMSGCAGASDGEVADYHEGDGPIGATSEALSGSDTVATAVAKSCTTTSVKALAQQLVDEIQCMRPGTFASIDKTPGLALGSAVFPYLQTNAAKALAAAQKARGTTMSINSALRTLPQQYLLYRWYQTGRCGIGLAASPGTSNHEGGLALDVNDDAGWRPSMTSHGFRWLGASDPVHFDYVGGGTVDLRGLSVKAFQRLWNRNHPGDLIDEDGAYGPMTESRLAQAPVGGFPKGATCTGADAGDDAGADPAEPHADPPVTQSAEATEPAPDAPPPSPPPAAGEGGCATAPRGRSGPGEAGAAMVAAAMAISLARRGRRRDAARG